MTFRKLALSLAALAVFLTLPAVWACSCAPPPEPAAALAQSSSVFLGKVTAIDEGPKDSFSLVVTIDVERWWKGGDTAQVKVTTIKSGAACGYGFQKDARYMVYTHGKGPMHSVSLCSRTALAKNAEAAGDFKALGEGTKPK